MVLTGLLFVIMKERSNVRLTVPVPAAARPTRVPAPLQRLEKKIKKAKKAGKKDRGADRTFIHGTWETSNVEYDQVKVNKIFKEDLAYGCMSRGRVVKKKFWKDLLLTFAERSPTVGKVDMSCKSSGWRFLLKIAGVLKPMYPTIIAGAPAVDTKSDKAQLRFTRKGAYYYQDKVYKKWPRIERWIIHVKRPQKGDKEIHATVSFATIEKSKPSDVMSLDGCIKLTLRKI